VIRTAVLTALQVPDLIGRKLAQQLPDLRVQLLELRLPDPVRGVWPPTDSREETVRETVVTADDHNFGNSPKGFVERDASRSWPVHHPQSHSPTVRETATNP
jgi:hypothetical protein